MKISSSILIALVLILLLFPGSGLTACFSWFSKSKTDNSGQDGEPINKQLRAELSKLRSFRAEGIVQGEYQQISLRKMFVFVKSGSEMRMDVFEGGIFGMLSEPLVSAYMGDYITVRSSMFPKLEEMAEKIPDDVNPALGLALLDSLIILHAKEIEKNREVEIDSIRFVFNRKMQLISIEDQVHSNLVNIQYNRKKNPSRIDCQLGKMAKLVLLIDNIQYKDYKVEKLPPPFLRQEIDGSQLLDPQDIDLLYKHGFEDL